MVRFIRYAAFVLVIALLAIPAMALKIYVNPSNQTGNYSPDGAYQEAANMQDVGSRLVTKLNNRGFTARNSGMMEIGAAMADSNSFAPDCFISLHSDSTGSGGWSSAHGTRAFFYQSSGGWHDDRNVDFANHVGSKIAQKFGAFGRNNWLGTQPDYPWLNWNIYNLRPDVQYAIPTTLIEGLYHDNWDDVYGVLLTTAGRDAYAQGAFEGICDYYGLSYVAGYPYWPWKSNSPVNIPPNNGIQEIFAKGANGHIYRTCQNGQNGTSWYNWTDMGFPVTAASDPVVATNMGGGNEVFVIGTNNQLYHCWQAQASGGWSSWVSLGGTCNGTPSIGLITTYNGLEVFVHWTDNSIRHIWQLSSSGNWSAWESLDGNVAGNPVAALNPDGRQEFFVRGGNGKMYHRWKTSIGGGWSAWTEIVGLTIMAGDPAIGMTGNGRIELYIRNSDRSLYHACQNSTSVGTSWSGWAGFGGSSNYDLAIGRSTGSTQYAFHTGGDNQIWNSYQSTVDGAWSAWGGLGGSPTRAPWLCHNHDGRAQLFIVQSDGYLYTKWQLSGGGWSAWTAIGGSAIF